MTFWGELPDGTEMLLGEPLEVEYLWDRDAPASQLRAVFPMGEPWGDLARVRVFHQGEAVFGGVVDEQNATLSGEGMEVELVCRSLEALLLDNEACPAVVRSPSLGALWEKYFRELGFSGVRGDQSPKAGELAVGKGVSCWELLEGFCHDYLGCQPWVDGAGVLRCDGAPETHLEAGAALWAQLSRLPCKQLSAVWLQSFRGSYDTPFRNPQAQGVCRQRYLSREDGRDPRALLDEAQGESRLLTVECLGFLWPGQGALASVQVPQMGRFERCPVRSVRSTLDSRGQRTRLTLEGGCPPCG